MTVNMVKKTTYSAPEAEFLEVRFEENFLTTFDKENNTETLTEDEEIDL